MTRCTTLHFHVESVCQNLCPRSLLSTDLLSRQNRARIGKAALLGGMPLPGVDHLMPSRQKSYGSRLRPRAWSQLTTRSRRPSGSLVPMRRSGIIADHRKAAAGAVLASLGAATGSKLGVANPANKVAARLKMAMRVVAGQPERMNIRVVGRKSDISIRARVALNPVWSHWHKPILLCSTHPIGGPLHPGCRDHVQAPVRLMQTCLPR